MIPNNSGCSVAGPALPPGYKSSCSSETPDSDDDSESLPLPRDTNGDSEEETEGDPAPKWVCSWVICIFTLYCKCYVSNWWERDNVV